VFFGTKKFFVSEFDETLHIDAPFDGDHFIINKFFCQVINKHFIPFFKNAVLLKKQSCSDQVTHKR
jgi:hypothetical protein